MMLGREIGPDNYPVNRAPPSAKYGSGKLASTDRPYDGRERTGTGVDPRKVLGGGLKLA